MIQFNVNTCHYNMIFKILRYTNKFCWNKICFLQNTHDLAVFVRTEVIFNARKNSDISFTTTKRWLSFRGPSQYEGVVLPMGLQYKDKTVSGPPYLNNKNPMYRKTASILKWGPGLNVFSSSVIWAKEKSSANKFHLAPNFPWLLEW